MLTDIVEINQSHDVSVWNKNLSQRYKPKIMKNNQIEKSYAFKPNMPLLSTIGLSLKAELHQKYWIIDPADYEQVDIIIKSGKKLTDKTDFSL
jgi:hypothetical protein